ncbi:MAG: addiction module toxin RelE [Acidobacteriota bacterium]
MQTIAETSEFLRKSGRLLDENEKMSIIEYLALHPKAGTVLQGTGGIRKLRRPRKGMGKSGGFRIIHDKSMPLYLLTVFGKGEKQNLSKRERNELGKLVKLLVQSWKNRQGEPK